MTGKKMMTVVLTLLFSFVFVNVSFAREVADDIFPVDRSFTGSTMHQNVSPDANWLAIAATPSEIELSDTPGYQLNPDRFVQHDHNTTVSSAGERLDKNANWLSIASTPSEIELQQSPEYQLNKDTNGMCVAC